MHHLASAQAALRLEDDTVRREYAWLLARGNRKLARVLYRANRDEAHYKGGIELERRLKESDKRYAVRLIRYGLKVREIVGEVDGLLKMGIRRASQSSSGHSRTVKGRRV